MSLVAAAVCPHPPLLIPELAAGASAELDELRTACDAAVAQLLTADADALLVVGAGARTGYLPGPASGTFAAYGVDLPVQLGSGTPTAPDLPLSLAVGAWLLSRQPAPAPAPAPAPDAFASGPGARAPGSPVTCGLVVGPGESVRTCARLGEELIQRGAGVGQEPTQRVALLVMGDGSACRSVKAPGYFDPRAEPFDAAVAAAFAAADPYRLFDLATDVAEELRCAGRAPWQVLAGAVAADGRPWAGEVRYDAAPYGVGYLVASWWPR